ncbi:MAG: tRNA (adenosine(37)-N6)-threonylcarbamoyltransferase complex dimerization subunit type 1 TsaB [Betaproteobacteria bacterium AqS2]|uniref:tRNA threonylcarbamoyladenosine biosynthesis protein TsaB n=1 Tax=Candidatus Amphirhobacter heronislandensis TaxID=1732024 RepID=A0A930UEX4_9GAMM|nr:tRNA (adenosine(37)-N6)-threonylcarbamoyltransferase complex dimerization subunit type 1 TsaB [Betaproteobacteria bacterium AqS2]
MSGALAIDCTFGGFSAAVAGPGGIIDEHHPDVHASEGLIDCVDRLLRDAGLELAGLDFLACGVGPGNFTGIRTACGTVQGFGFVHKLPAAGIVSTLALARASGCQRRCAVACRAHRGHCYLASYEAEDGELRERDAPALHALDGLPPLEGDWELCLHGRMKDERKAFVAAVTGAATLADCHEGSLAPTVLELGRQERERDELVDVRALKPLYVRNKIALTKEEHRAGMRL